MSVTVLLSEMCVIFLMIAIGFFLKKRRLLSDAAIEGISFLIVNVTNPCLLVDSALSYEGRLALHDFSFALGWSVLLFALLIAASYLIPALLRIPRDTRYAFKMLTVYGNCGFIGIPVCKAVLGDESLVYLTIYCVIFNFIIYTYGMSILHRAKRMQDLAGDSSDRFLSQSDLPQAGIIHTLRKILNPGTICGIIALGCYLLDPPVPKILSEVISYAADPTIFLSMIVLGSSMASAPLKDYVKMGRKMALYLIIRMLVLPILLLLLMKPFINDPILLGTLTIMVSLPGGNLPLIMAKEIGLDDRDLSKGIILTTILCLVTIPVVCMVL